ncbi:MAG: AAA family ATPase, partial [Rhodobacteraceae bacterium]|nr:AAA family ATPase [Paracoccaceae bacterium]
RFAQQILRPLAALQQLVQQFVRNRHRPCSSQEAWTQSAVHRRPDTLLPHEVGNQYNINITNQRPVNGIFVPSHRPVYVYAPVSTIPTSLNARQRLLDTYLNELRQRYQPNARTQSASFRLKEALISLATFGYGNQAVARNEDAIQTLEGFEAVLKKVLPKSLGFQRIMIRLPEVVLDTDTGEFSLDAVSGGVSAIIDMSWQLHMATLVYGSLVAIIDEPENHLHPTLQKTLLPDFMEAFPQVQFIIATHNPFMVTSVADSNVYVLDYDNEVPSRVFSTKLDLINRAGSSNDILREVLGLEHTKPLWVETKIEEIVERYGAREIDDTTLRELREELRQLKLEEFIPETISRVAKT